MRWPGILVRVLGWLLTPLVAWAASFYGAWVLLQLEGAFSNPRVAIYAAFAAALITGTVLMYVWIQLLRRSPRLRHTLHVDRAGLPVLDEAREEAAEVVEPPAEEVRRDEAS
jgi:uncharacterized membrane protein YkvI